jgi:hypothetical protein
MQLQKLSQAVRGVHVVLDDKQTKRRSTLRLRRHFARDLGGGLRGEGQGTGELATSALAVAPRRDEPAVRFPAVQLLVAELAAALSRADPCLDLELIDDAAAGTVDPDDGSVGAALIELTNGFLMLVVVSRDGADTIFGGGSSSEIPEYPDPRTRRGRCRSPPSTIARRAQE